MNLKTLVSIFVGIGLPFFMVGQDLQKDVTVLTEKLSKTLVSKGTKKIATVDFVNLEGQTTELGRFLAVLIGDEMVNRDGISVTDRSNFKSILAEHKLSAEGLVNPENAKKLGKFAGVDALLVGTVTSLGNAIVLNVRVVATETAVVVATGMLRFNNTPEIQQLANRVASPSTSSNSVVSPDRPKPETIAYKDFGDLRVSLKTITFIKNDGANKGGISWVFDFHNRNTIGTLLVAVNATPVVLQGWGRGGIGEARGQMVDSARNRLGVSQLSGLSTISVYATDMYGEVKTTRAEQIIYCLKNGRNVSADKQNATTKDWLGDFTEIPPSQIRSVTMLCSPTDNYSATDNVMDKTPFEFSVELVKGFSASGNPKNCSLHTLIFSNVRLP